MFVPVLAPILLNKIVKMKGYTRRLLQKIFRISFLFALRIVEEALFWQCKSDKNDKNSTTNSTTNSLYAN